jgi:hypothetical protein
VSTTSIQVCPHPFVRVRRWYVVDLHAPQSRRYLNKRGEWVGECSNCWWDTMRAAEAAAQDARELVSSRARRDGWTAAEQLARDAYGEIQG